MKVCLVGHYSSRQDEGSRIVARSMYRELQNEGVETLALDMHSFKNPSEIRRFNPDILHFILTPTLGGFIAARTLSLLHRRPKVVVSAVHPGHHVSGWVRYLLPDLILVQSEASRNIFASMGAATQFFPNGVDTDKFRPTSVVDKEVLRRQYGVPLDKFVILHLASIQEARNLMIFRDLRRLEGTAVLIIGRADENYRGDIALALRNAGCEVWIEHFERIEDIYKLSDCYVFPTVDPRACIETPLSILEAMACNLPVVTTRFGALPALFREGDGIFFADSGDQILERVGDLLLSSPQIRTREKVLPYSWKNNIDRLIQIYSELKP